MNLRAPLLAAGGVLALQSGHAMAEEKLTLDISAGASASRNPYLQAGDDTAAASAFIQVDPQIQFIDEDSEVTLNGSLRYNRFTSHYGDDVSAQAGLNVERRLSPATAVHGRATAQVARTSALDFISVPGFGQPDETSPAVLPDVTFAGTRSRTTVFYGNVGIDHDLNPRERLAADFAATETRFSRAGQSDYRFLTGDFEYRRTVSERTSAFAALRIGYSDFLGTRLDDGVVIAPTIGIATKLNPRLSLEAGLGASLTKVNDLGGRKNSRLAPSARIVLCETVEASKGCVKISRGSQPTALSGLTTVTTASFSYSRPINQRDQFATSASYTRTDGSSNFRRGQNNDLLVASATYDRTFSRRFSAYVNPTFARIFDSGSSRRDDIAIRIGIRYRLGSEG